ncbi:MAG: Lrp/AsnC ligand binding domain-containing protein [Candidatus Stahlbacteria bacterium]|nr:Lrp/AsnC ligand binding domain-containing protein [Candidatus Stahlbacteria bacterium]
MAISSYIFIKAAPGTLDRVLGEVKVFPYIETANIVTGIHDIVAIVKTDTLISLQEGVVEKIYKLSDVHSVSLSIIIS